MGSPKRKGSPETDVNLSATPASKRPRTGSMPSQPTPPDSHINHTAAIAYWSSTEPTVNGVLGGYPQVSRVDLQGSSNFFAKLQRQSSTHPASKKLSRAVDCGAGIGRITEGFLSRVAEVTDIVEPVKSFTDQIAGKEGVGTVYNVGLEAWEPGVQYDLIWNQWCVGQLTDAQLIDYLKKLPRVLTKGGWIVVKENLSNHHAGEDVYDETDSSVTRTDEKFRALFERAELRLVSTEVQRGMPKGLYPVRVYALQPR